MCLQARARRGCVQKWGSCLCPGLPGHRGSNVPSAPAPLGFAPGRRAPGVIKATVNAIPPVPCANSLVTLLSCLLFASTLRWIWGGQLACNWDNQPASSADSDSLNISPH